MKSEISATQFRTFAYNENSKCDTISKASICNYVTEIISYTLAFSLKVHQIFSRDGIKGKLSLPT